jgi:hypothetical protein
MAACGGIHGLQPLKTMKSEIVLILERPLHTTGPATEPDTNGATPLNHRGVTCCTDHADRRDEASRYRPPNIPQRLNGCRATDRRIESGDLPHNARPRRHGSRITERRLGDAQVPRVQVVCLLSRARQIRRSRGGGRLALLLAAAVCDPATASWVDSSGRAVASGTVRVHHPAISEAPLSTVFPRRLAIGRRVPLRPAGAHASRPMAREWPVTS